MSILNGFPRLSPEIPQRLLEIPPGFHKHSEKISQTFPRDFPKGEKREKREDRRDKGGERRRERRDEKKEERGERREKGEKRD